MNECVLVSQGGKSLSVRSMRFAIFVLGSGLID